MLGQYFGCTCQSSAGIPGGMSCTKVLKHIHRISFRQLFPHCSLYTYTCTQNPTGCFTTAQRMSNCETGQSGRLSNSIYPLQQGELEPSSQKICYLLETNSIFHLARSEEMNTKDSAGCWGWLVQKENSQKHIPKQSRERVMQLWENKTRNVRGK